MFASPSAKISSARHRSSTLEAQPKKEPTDEASHQRQSDYGASATAPRATVPTSPNDPSSRNAANPAPRVDPLLRESSWVLADMPRFSANEQLNLADNGLAARQLGVQAKLTVGSVDDPLEHEADRVADSILRAPVPGVSVSYAPPQINRKWSSRSGQSGAAAEAPRGVHNVLGSVGEPLDAGIRAFMEPRFGREFGNVRVHSDRSSSESAQCLAARAYTCGSHIVFGSGQYSPASDSGRHLIAHELAHVIQQTSAHSAGYSGHTIQRQAVPPEQFARLIEEIDAKLGNPKLSDSERIELLRRRQSYWEDLKGMEDSRGGVPANYRFTAPDPSQPPKATPRFQSQTEATPAPSAPPQGQKLKPVPTTGTPGSRESSAKALADKGAPKGTVPPPSTPYKDTSAAPRNPDEKAKRAEESAIGKRLNEMAVAGDLGEVRRVEGRRPIPGESSDYKFQLKDGSSQSADLYSPASSTPPENAALEAIKKKSAQGEVLVLHLSGVERPLEYAQAVAEALIVTPNHGLKRLIAFSDYKILISRSLTVDGKALAKIQQRVAARLAEQAKSEKITRPESAKLETRTPSKPMKLSPAQMEQLRSEMATDRIKSMFEEGMEDLEPKEGLFNDPNAVNLETPSGTNLSTHAAVEGAAQEILGAQLQSVRNAEAQKAMDAWNGLQKKIEGLRSGGHDVKIVVVAQVPKQGDVAAYVTGVGDAGQVVYFQEMYIAEAPFARRRGIVPAKNNSNTMATMQAASPEVDKVEESLGERDQFERPGWTEAMQETYEIYGHAENYKPPRNGFRYVAETLVLPAY